ncbi:MAG: hypothetical protein SFX72_15300 [Isosphaeraceae bacterium]|nr:hypothetical protein [Isosphaeraceae bacterium]
MSRTARILKGVGPLALGSLLLSGVAARAEEPTSLSAQLTNLGRQALAQGQSQQARTFLDKALALDPNNLEAKAALAKVGRPSAILVKRQDPTPPPPAPALDGDAPATAPAPAPSQANLERQSQIENIRRQEFATDIGSRLQRARDLDNGGNPEAALVVLRSALAAIQSADQVDPTQKTRLENQVRSQIGATERHEERLTLERAERYRVAAAESARIRLLEDRLSDQHTVGTLMAEFDSLMDQGKFIVFSNLGTGDIDATTAPFTEARDRARAARAIFPYETAPVAGLFTSQTIRFFAQSWAYEELKEYRFMLSLQDVDRAAVPFPDTRVIEYPSDFKELTERRQDRYGDAEKLLNQNDRTRAITAALNDNISLAYPQETPLEDVLKFIKTHTSDKPGLPSGIPIYVDPIGLQEAERTLSSPVTIDLEGISLKTALRLILRQLDLTYTVKDGLLTITSATADDQPTEIRIYQVADLSVIPISLFGGGGMGGGMGGMGGMGGGGMGGMGGMGGGGMGGMGGMGGGMGGFGSVPPVDPALLLNAPAEKKSR